MPPPSYLTSAAPRINRRPTRSQTTDESENVVFPRRYPRIGNAFQHKFPKQSLDCVERLQLLDRPAPLKMSVDVPYRTEQDLEALINSNEDANLPEPWAPPAPPSSTVAGYEPTPPETYGGIALHIPTVDQGAWLAFCDALLVPSLAMFTATAHDDTAWMKEWMDWHAANTAAAAAEETTRQSGFSRGGGRKSRFKRPRVMTHHSLPESLIKHNPALPTRLSASKVAKTSSMERNNVAVEAMEAEPHWLQYLHGRPLRQAQWQTLVQLSGGQAASMLRTRARKGANLTFWKDQWSWMSSTTHAMRGDYRDVPVPAYSRNDEGATNGATAAPPIIDNVPDEMWQAAAACVQAMETQVQAKDDPVMLTTLVQFLHRVASLPPPQRSLPVAAVDEVQARLARLVTQALAARMQRAKLLDAWGTNGLDVDVARKLLDTVSKSALIVVDELPELQRQVDQVAAWQKDLDQVLVTDDDGEAESMGDFDVLQCLCDAGQLHGFRSKALVSLEARLARVAQLRRRILEWKEACSKGIFELMKSVGALVRDIYRSKVHFAEAVELLAVFKDAEAWVDRASIAIRSRIHVNEVYALIDKGKTLPLDLAEFLEKLESRVAACQEWIKRCNAIVPISQEKGAQHMLHWVAQVRRSFTEGNYNALHELACDGSRIPVDIDCVNLLQLECDARGWMAKFSKWIAPPDWKPAGKDQTKCGKLEDLRDHLAKAAFLRDRLTSIISSPEHAQQWLLQGEAELQDVVRASDAWLERYKILEKDDSNSQEYSISNGPAEVPLCVLRKLHADADTIYANLGTPAADVAKALEEADAWFDRWCSVLAHCKIGDSKMALGRPATLDEMQAAVLDADENLPIDLAEAMELARQVERAKSWCEESLIAVEGKRLRRGKKILFQLEELSQLMGIAATLPIDTDDLVNQLGHRLGHVERWREGARIDMLAIEDGFVSLRESIAEAYGEPVAFRRQGGRISQHWEAAGADVPSEDTAGNNKHIESKAIDHGAPGPNDDASQSGTISTSSASDFEGPGILGENEARVGDLIRKLAKEAKTSCIVTSEGEKALCLENVWQWCLRSFRYLDSNREVFDKRFFGAFDRFISEGEALVINHGGRAGEPVSNAWDLVVRDQLVRLRVLLAERDRFNCWSDKAVQTLFSEDARPTRDDVENVVSQARLYPPDCDLVEKTKQFYAEFVEWADEAEAALSGDDKLALHPAKLLLDAGEKLRVQCIELKALRQGLKTARSWANRVRQCKIDDGSASVQSARDLIEEHDSLIVRMPEELIKLDRALKRYCLCRRPYDGFMICCDSCGDWFHGACMGVSEAKADKVEKYTCVRCRLVSTYMTSATRMANIIRKWSCASELRKSHQIEIQRYDRKVKKEAKDIRKLHEQMQDLTRVLENNNFFTLPSKNVGADESVHDTPTPFIGAQVPDTLSADSLVERTGDLDASATASVENGRDQLLKRLQDIKDAIAKGEERYNKFSRQLLEQKSTHEVETSYQFRLQQWCFKIGRLVLFPSSADNAKDTAPTLSGGQPAVMRQLMLDAEHDGLSHVDDVKEMENAFVAMGWALGALDVLRKQPTSLGMERVIARAATLHFYDEKALRILRALWHRVSSWQTKAERALAPCPGSARPYDLPTLKLLLTIAEDIPVVMAMEQRLLNVIEDKGLRHCICGGPSDGRFMLTCDGCDRWFHGKCVEINPNASAILENWKCPTCTGSKKSESLNLDSFYCGDDETDEQSEDDDIASKAPNPIELWPPFGLGRTDKAIGVLGASCFENMCNEVAHARIKNGSTFARSESVHSQRASTLADCKAASGGFDGSVGNDGHQTNQRSFPAAVSIEQTAIIWGKSDGFEPGKDVSERL